MVLAIARFQDFCLKLIFFFLLHSGVVFLLKAIFAFRIYGIFGIFSLGSFCFNLFPFYHFQKRFWIIDQSNVNTVTI